jgi:hypothetical protein
LLRAYRIGGGGPCPLFNYTLALALQLRKSTDKQPLVTIGRSYSIYVRGDHNAPRVRHLCGSGKIPLIIFETKYIVLLISFWIIRIFTVV